MRIGNILKENQPDIHKQLNNNEKSNNKKKIRKHKDHLSFHDVENMMRHDSYNRGAGGALRQRAWSE